MSKAARTTHDAAHACSCMLGCVWLAVICYRVCSTSTSRMRSGIAAALTHDKVPDRCLIIRSIAYSILLRMLMTPAFAGVSCMQPQGQRIKEQYHNLPHPSDHVNIDRATSQSSAISDLHDDPNHAQVTVTASLLTAHMRSTYLLPLKERAATPDARVIPVSNIPVLQEQQNVHCRDISAGAEAFPIPAIVDDAQRLHASGSHPPSVFPADFVYSPAGPDPVATPAARRLLDMAYPPAQAANIWRGCKGLGGATENGALLLRSGRSPLHQTHLKFLFLFL